MGRLLLIPSELSVPSELLVPTGLRAAVRLLAAAFVFSALSGCASGPPLRLITGPEAPETAVLGGFAAAIRAADSSERRLHAVLADQRTVLLIVEVSARPADQAGAESDFVDALTRERDEFLRWFPDSGAAAGAGSGPGDGPTAAEAPRPGNGPSTLAWLFARRIPAMGPGGARTEVLLGTMSYWSDPTGRALWAASAPATDADWLSGYRDWVQVADHSIIIPAYPGLSFLSGLRGGRLPELETAL